MHRFSPVVATDEPEGLRLDATACGVLFGGEHAMARAITQRLARLGFTARVAIAPTYAAAWALARHAPSANLIIHDDDLRPALAPLPVAALDADADTVIALAEVGVERIEHLLDLPRSALRARFGEPLTLRLEQAIAHAFEPIEPVREKPPLRIARAFNGPTRSLEGLEHTLRDLLEQLSNRLQTHERGARRLAVTLERADLQPLTLEKILGRATRDARHLYSLIHPDLERAQMGFGVEAVKVEATETAPIPHEQMERWRNAGAPDAADRRRLAELIDTLANRLSRDRVRAVEPVESHLPERAFRPRPAADTLRTPTARHALSTADRPTTLLQAPAPASVMAATPDGPVLAVRWRGEHTGVASCKGPERIAPEWWRAPTHTRDYFKVHLDQGPCLWLYRELETGRWFVHGVWS
jgi:protein ImuB